MSLGGASAHQLSRRDTPDYAQALAYRQHAVKLLGSSAQASNWRLRRTNGAGNAENSYP